MSADLNVLSSYSTGGGATGAAPAPAVIDTPSSSVPPVSSIPPPPLHILVSDAGTESCNGSYTWNPAWSGPNSEIGGFIADTEGSGLYLYIPQGYTYWYLSAPGINYYHMSTGALLGLWDSVDSGMSAAPLISEVVPPSSVVVPPSSNPSPDPLTQGAMLFAMA